MNHFETEKPRDEPAGTVNLCEGKSVDGALGVLLMLSPSSITQDRDGQPTPGVLLAPWSARRIAYILLQLAEEAEARMKMGLTD